MTEQTPPPLEGIRVIDATSGVAGQYAGKLLAAYGADVILVEPPGGSPTRAMDPQPYLFEHLNAGKRSAVLDVGTDSGRTDLRQLCADADLVLREAAESWPLPPSPELVDCVVSDFPQRGAYADWQGTEMIHQAMSGTMVMTGDTDREPLYGIGRRAYYATGMTAFVTAMSALVERHRSQLGQHVHATVFEAAAAMGQNLVTQYSYNGSYQTRARYPGFLGVLHCRDAWVVLFALRSWGSICDMFGAHELADDPRFQNPVERQAHWADALVLLEKHAGGLSSTELIERGQQAKVNIEQVASLEELTTGPHWQAREMTVIRTAPDGTEQRSLGPVFRFAGSPYLGHRPAPAPGTQRPSFRKVQPTSTGSAPWETRPAAGHGPLRGVRVLDFTTAWAGPMATRSLAFLGAQVIKIEPPTKLDSWRGTYRGGVPERYPDRDPGEKPYNRNCLFNTQSHDKWSLSLDLKKPGTVDLVLELARHADLVMANYSAGVLDRLGVGYDRLVEVNPGIIVVEMPAFGVGGPMTRHVGMGKTMEAANGMASLMGYGDGRPVLTGPAYLDPIGGLNGVAAAVAALWQRARTGRGAHIEVAQTEAASHWIGEYILEQLDTGRSWHPRGNRVAGYAPHDAYRAGGHDQWVAIAVGSDEQWLALCRTVGRPDLAESERYATASTRWDHQDELRDEIEAWTRARTKHEAAALLQGAGVAAAPVNISPDIITDPVLRQEGFIVTLDHPEAGRHEYPSLAYRLDRTPGGMRQAAPVYGQHNRDVLGGLLGLGEEQIQELYEVGAVADDPHPGSGPS